ncbi:MAG: DNA-3-methyladenine glycosylase [Pseudohongiella sp.]|nr:DNA-3-methyladenine glycosylase [Pseudohongiella sp.]MDO9519274.1 DNA-3-methyladenine glycosylase [Pseudohongiella sp.]MDP2126115.1 DNA-3-methyladenine glycosylase [Pseudohongiella sp.]
MIIMLDDAHRARAIEHLSRKDKKLAALIRQVGECRLGGKNHPDLFGTLADAIVSQQLSGKAAATIFARFCVLLGAGDKKPQPAQLSGVTEEQLRSVGLSRAKSLAVLDLADKIENGSVLPLSTLETMPDEDIIQNLIQVRGIGRWTAEMFLMFQLGRSDVLPVDDLGVRKGFMLTYGLDVMPDKKLMTQHALKWQPYRSVASWYMWRAAEQG